MLHSTSSAGSMGTLSSGSSPIVTLFITSEDAKSERRFSKSLTVLSLKEKLEPITGVPAASMALSLYTPSNVLVANLSEDERLLGYYGAVDFMILQVSSTSTTRRRFEYSDVSAVEKFEISQEEYEKRSDSVRAYKQRHKIGRFAEKKEEDIALEEALEEAGKELCQSIQIGNRCLVDTGSGVLSKKGSVKYVGQVEFQKGYWVGIQYDEPLGKHNGTVQGKAYFECPNKYGAFVRPDKVTVGDYPEDDLMDDDDDEF